MKFLRAVAAFAIAIAFVAGDGPTVSAAGPGSSTFVPITPCRLMDTRSGAQVGPRGTPINAGETYAAMVWGTNGNCTIPSSATAVSLNVTFVAPTSGGFVTVYPPDQPWPGTSNLNFSAGQAPAPNNVTSPLSADGKIGFFNAAGTVHLIADIVGYYDPAGAPDADTVIGACSAQLRWDLVDHCQTDEYATAANPDGIAFDGTYLWIAATGGDRVSRIDPETGARTDFPTGDGPTKVAFDGTNIWVTNNLADTVSRINPTTGSKTDFATGDSPFGVAFDGTSIWVTNTAADTVSKINPTTGTRTDFATGNAPMGVAFDGARIWVVNNLDDGVSRIDPATGGEIDAFATSEDAREIAFDGTSMWISNFSQASVTRVLTTNLATQSFSVGSGPTGIAFDGTSIWVTASLDGEVAKVNIKTGTVRLYGAGNVPTGIAFDGSNVWVTDSTSAEVLKFLAGRGVLDSASVGSSDSSTFVPITPCRLMDTRPGAQVGPRGTPINPGETYSPMVWGTNGNCNIPSSATAVSLNVTFVAPTAAGFVAVFPPDKPWPGTSNLNFSAGQAPAPNGVTSPLSADGRLGFLNAFGQVHLLADIVGYYEIAGSAPRATVFGDCGSLLRWDLPGCDATAYPTGNNPTALAFDGTSIWIANEQDNTVSKMNPNTGAKVDYPTGNTPSAVMFDGISVWVTNTGSDTVSKFNPSTGTRTDFATGNDPRGVAFDGTNLWVTNAGDSTVSKMNPTTGVKVDFGTGDTPMGVAFDGSSIWIANYNGNTVSKMNPADGSLIATYATGSNPTAVAFDGTRVWVTNTTSHNVSRINPINGDKTDFGVQFSPMGVAFDGTNIWVANSGSDSVSKVNITDGTRVDYATGDGANGVAFDGGNIWVTNEIAKTVTKLLPSASAMRLSAVVTEGSSTLVPITPCRLMDTRSTSTIGPRSTPIGAGETYSALVWGTNGNCTIPTSATALSLNVTFVGPTAGGFVTVYPPDKPWPGTSNLNFSAGQAPAPNGVTSPLSFDGKIGFFNAAGTVNLIADIVGYYEPIEVPATRCLPLLRWDLPECTPSSFSTGADPEGVAFDGTSVWVTNFVGDSVSKIDPITGAKVDYPTGNGAFGIVFDGSFIWVTNSLADTVSKVDPQTGAELAEYATPDEPLGIAFDGTSLWIANNNAGNVSKMNPADGTRTDHTTNTEPWGVVFDGRNIYVTNRGADTVSKMDLGSGNEITEFATGDQPLGIGFDGTNLWVANVASDTVSRMSPVDGAKTDYVTEDGPSYFAFDGISMWVVTQNAARIGRIDITSGAQFSVEVGNNPLAIGFDGDNIWVTRWSANLLLKIVV